MEWGRLASDASNREVMRRLYKDIKGDQENKWLNLKKNMGSDSEQSQKHFISEEKILFFKRKSKNDGEK